MLDYNTFKEEHSKWVECNFPNAKPHQPLLGLIEEAGELVDAIDIKDSVGDMLIYLTHYCKLQNIDWLECKKNSEYIPVRIKLLIDLVSQFGKLAHAQLKGEQSIRHTDKQIINKKMIAVGNIVTILEFYCGKITLMECLEFAWNEVKQRNWQKNKITGEIL